MRVFRRGFVNRIPKRPLGKARPGVAHNHSAAEPRLRESLSWSGIDPSLNTNSFTLDKRRLGRAPGALACLVTRSEY